MTHQTRRGLLCLVLFFTGLIKVTCLASSFRSFTALATPPDPRRRARGSCSSSRVISATSDMDASSRLSLAPETDEPSSESSYSPSSLTREGALLLIKVFGLRLASSMSMSSSDNTALGAGFGITTPGVGEIKGSSGRRPLLLAGRPGAALGAGDFPLLAGTRMVTGVRAGGGLLAPPKVYWGDSASSESSSGVMSSKDTLVVASATSSPRLPPKFLLSIRRDK
ncbi:hypothetical protein TOPH_05758 [Tolypocladium ophioglossoides CBS 100239]|uniref:Uncharacterized protein n=1 Tax=Tolypocladium ophioglossoides (strain CBS 100239) TaxID=1163406 RepID=A0A0L0N6M2_TOLOC|nr:hypothetical protein TOPH_05758 [Tolypocladium ophioglossoides CBS 100239]